MDLFQSKFEYLLVAFLVSIETSLRYNEKVFYLYYLLSAITFLACLMFVWFVSRRLRVSIGFFELLLFFTLVSFIAVILVAYSVANLTNPGILASSTLIVFFLLILFFSSNRIKKVGIKKSLASSLVVVFLLFVTLAVWQTTKTKYIGSDLLLYNLDNEIDSVLYGVRYVFETDRQRGDIVIHKHEWADNIFIRSRIIGLPNEKITITNSGEVLINDNLIEEEYSSRRHQYLPMGKASLLSNTCRSLLSAR